MPLFSANFGAAFQPPKSLPLYPFVEIGFPGGTKLLSESGIAVPGIGAYDGRIDPKGYQKPKRGVSNLNPSLGLVSMALTVFDPDRVYQKILNGSPDPRRSTYTYYYGHPTALAKADWSVRFSGVLDKWDQPAGNADLWRLYGQTDDFRLDTMFPKKQVLKQENPLAPGTSFGSYMSAIWGTFDSLSTSGKGALVSIPISIDATAGYRYNASIGILKSIRNVFKNGALQTLTTNYTIDFPVLFGTQITRITMVQATVAGDVITFDADGYETVGDGTGTLILNPVDQMKHRLVNFVFGDYRSGPWLADATAPIDVGSFAAASTYAGNANYEGSNHEGGTTTQRRGRDSINEWLTSWQAFKLYWTPQGKLGIVPVLNPKHPGYGTSPGWLYGPALEKGVTFMPPGIDPSSIYGRVDVKYLEDPSANKQWASLAVQDTFAQEKVLQSITAIQSLGHY